MIATSHFAVLTARLHGCLPPSDAYGIFLSSQPHSMYFFLGNKAGLLENKGGLLGNKAGLLENKGGLSAKKAGLR